VSRLKSQYMDCFGPKLYTGSVSLWYMLQLTPGQNIEQNNLLLSSVYPLDVTTDPANPSLTVTYYLGADARDVNAVPCPGFSTCLSPGTYRLRVLSSFSQFSIAGHGPPSESQLRVSESQDPFTTFAPINVIPLSQSLGGVEEKQSLGNGNSGPAVEPTNQGVVVTQSEGVEGTSVDGGLSFRVGFSVVSLAVSGLLFVAVRFTVNNAGLLYALQKEQRKNTQISLGTADELKKLMSKES